MTTHPSQNWNSHHALMYQSSKRKCRPLMKLAAILAINGTIAIHLHAATIPFNTSTLINNWTVTAGGAVDATPYPFDVCLSISSTGTGIGTFVDGGSFSQFSGFWTARYLFFLPAEAVNVTLTFSDLRADDRAVLTLNGTRIGAAGIILQGGGNSGSMVLTDGGPLLSYTFDGASGSVSGNVTSGFKLGGMNTVQGIVNNTDTGISGPVLPIFAGSSIDGTTFGVSGFVTYTMIPEPAAWTFFLLGLALLMPSAKKTTKKPNGS
jgi:hypothetical protein